MDLDAASAVSSLIGEQADQLWSAAMALIVAEIYIACRFFAQANGSVRWLPTGALMALSIVLHVVSLACGYLTKGALIIMTKSASEKLSTVESYANAELMALLQFLSVSIGLVLFVLVFTLDFSGMAKILGEKQ